MFDHDKVSEALRLIFEGIEKLQNSCERRRNFTIDGRLVGDIGELIAEREFEIELDLKSRSHHDAMTSDKRDVQVKATFKDSLTFRTEPTLYIGLKLSRNGAHEIIFNGPGRYISEVMSFRKGFGVKLISITNKDLRAISEKIPEPERVPLRVLNISREA
jgi:hypothetical protein